MRDYIADMDALITSMKEERTSRSAPYSPRLLAAKIVRHCDEQDPDLLVGWLLHRAEDVLWQNIRDRDRSTRAHARTATSRTAFGRAAERAENGDRSEIVNWLSTPWSIGSGNTKTLGSMTSDDLIVSASYYESQARRNEMQSLFLQAIAKRVGDGVVSDVYTNADLEMMWNSLGS